jgi:hypothetical protein
MSESAKNGNNTGKSLRSSDGRSTGRPFTPGDPRINRKGRPPDFDALRALCKEMGHETIRDKNGKLQTNVEKVMRAWMLSKNPVLQKAWVEYAWGAPPSKIEHEGIMREHIFVTFTKQGEQSSIVSSNSRS